MREIVIALGLIEQGDNYLLQLRGNDPKIGAAGLIGCFGGKIEDRESPVQAVRRELTEETNLNPTEDDFTELGVIEVVSDHQLEEVRVTGYLFKTTVNTDKSVKAKEGQLVTIPKNKAQNYLDKMTVGTRTSFEQYILGG